MQESNPPSDPRDRSLVNQHSFTKEELIACAMGELFGPGRAHLPLDEMLMVDRITEINEDQGVNGKGRILAELDINRTASSILNPRLTVPQPSRDP